MVKLKEENGSKIIDLREHEEEKLTAKEKRWNRQRKVRNAERLGLWHKRDE